MVLHYIDMTYNKFDETIFSSFDFLVSMRLKHKKYQIVLILDCFKWIAHNFLHSCQACRGRTLKLLIHIKSVVLLICDHFLCTSQFLITNNDRAKTKEMNERKKQEWKETQNGKTQKIFEFDNFVNNISCLMWCKSRRFGYLMFIETIIIVLFWIFFSLLRKFAWNEHLCYILLL